MLRVLTHPPPVNLQGDHDLTSMFSARLSYLHSTEIYRHTMKSHRLVFIVFQKFLGYPRKYLSTPLILFVDTTLSPVSPRISISFISCIPHKTKIYFFNFI